MNWYKGNIAEAVALSKTRNAVFVVYVQGKDEATIKLESFINDPRISRKLQTEDFVAIKIEGESEAYMQFASIFQVVPVPSIFFIGKSGTPLEVATGVLSSVEELEGTLAKVLLLAGKNVATSSAAINEFIKEESKPSSTGEAVADSKDTKTDAIPENYDIVCKDGVCFKKAKESASTSSLMLSDSEGMKRDNTEHKSDCIADDSVCKDSVCVTKPNNNGGETEASHSNQEGDAKLAETRRYLEQKRCERVEEEKRLEKERELRRRKEGKEMQNLRAWQKDQELKELKENIKREKLEEQAARERIRAQIAADKAERVHKFAVDVPVATSSETVNNSSTTISSASDESRLQFRLASGAGKNHNFKCSTTLSEIRDYVTRELLAGTGIKDFSLATTFPKRELTSEHGGKTIKELDLFPSAVILIIGKEATGPTAIISRNGGFLNILYLTITAIFNPIFAIFSSAKNWLIGKQKESANIQSGGQKRASEDQRQQNEGFKRRNLDRFLTSGSGKTTGSSSQDQNDSTPGFSQGGGGYRRFAGESNVHRLSDNRKDSDDENATWNGNSTQQQ